jgi:hypothetical protein
MILGSESHRTHDHTLLSNSSGSLQTPSSLTQKGEVKVSIKVRITLRLAAYRLSVHLGVRPLETHDQRFFFSTELLRYYSLRNTLSDEKTRLSHEYAWPLIKSSFHTYIMLLKILPFALHVSPLLVQALQSRSCPSYVSYTTTTT